VKALTKRQQEVLSFIKEYTIRHKYPPAIRDIAGNFKISVKGAYDHVKALEKKQKIHCDLHRSRAIEVIEQDSLEEDELISVPILGNVAAGVPLFAEENFEGYIKLPSSIMKTGKHFALVVQGDSMQDAGILDGDLAVFYHQNTADNGNIIVAMMNEAVTLKRFFREKNRIKLKAENPIYPPIYTQNLQILGKLICIYRNYE
jgi:repressor LexA